MKKTILLFVFLLGNYMSFAQSNIAVTNTNSQTQYVPGSVVTYTATVTNLGPDTATNVFVTSIVSAGTTGQTWTGPGGSNGLGNIDHTIPSLAVGQTVNYTITFTVPVAFTGSLNCRVEAFLAGDPNTLNNWVNDMDTRATTADVSITNTNNQTGYDAGTTVTYTVNVLNNGLITAQGVVVSGIIPAGVSNYSWSGNGTSGTTALANTIGNLPVGQIVTYTVTFLIPSTSTANLVHQVSVSATTPDTILTNNTATDTDALRVGADLVVVNTDGFTTYTPGTQRTYTITVTNNGPTAAANVVITYTVPAAITSYSWSGNGANGVDSPLSNTIPSLAVGVTVTYTLIMGIPDNFTGNLTTTAGATSTTVDLVPGCSQCVDTNTLVNGANLQVTNTNNQIAYITGGTSIYTVRVRNLGPLNATNVLVTNPIPPGITSFAWTGNGITNFAGAINNTIPSLVVGQSVIYTITMQIPAALTGDLSSVASASSSIFDANLNNNTTTDTDIFGVGADIIVTNTDNSVYHTVGGTSEYIITVRNNGPFDAVNVLVTNPLPADAVTASWSGNGVLNQPGILSNTIPLLTVGQIITYTYNVLIPATQTTSVVSTTSITSDTVDPNPACAGCIDTSLSPINIANITITNTDASAVYTAGQPRVYTVTVRNIGPSIAENIVVTGSLTAGIDLAAVSWTGDNGSSGTGNLSATLATLNINTSVIYTVTVPVPPSFNQTTNLVHTINYTSSTTDPAPACPTCIDTDTPAPLANIVVSKTNNKTEYIRGENVNYTITVQNDGPSDAVNVVVNDPFPANITQMSWTSSAGGSGTGSLNQTIPSLAVNSVVTFTVTVRVPLSFPAGNLINTVTVTSGTNDPTPANNTATDTDVPGPSFVTIDTVTYTPTQLIQDVLINEPCVALSNFSASNPISFGYFNRNNADFPLKEGIIIRSGEAQRTQGIYVPETNAANSHSSTGSGIGDADLNAILTAQGFSANTVDASFISFDFTPTIENFNFRFLFASEEYGAQQCATPGQGFVDAFAFILTNLNTGTSQNLAIVPGTTTLIAAPTIRQAIYFTGGGTNCGDLNPQYFGRYNRSNIGPNPSGPIGSAINLAGQTVALRAEATVVPNTPYRLKLVVSDIGNTNLDSAVFLEAGSFNIGGPRITGSGLLVENTAFTGSDAPCAGVALTIQSGVAPTAGITYSWLKDGVLISGATNYNLVVNTAGTYTVIFTYSGGCALDDDIEIEYIPQTFPLMEEADDLFECNDATPLFDLTVNEPVVITQYESTEFNTFYYTTLEAAQSASGVPLTDAEKIAYPGVNGQDIWMKMVNFFTGGFCDPIRAFKLFLFAAPTATIANSTVICSGTAGGLQIQGTPDAIVSYTKNGVAQADITLSATGTFTIDSGVQTVATTTTNTYVLTNVESAATPPCSIAITGQTATVTINALPIASFTASSNIICQGTTTSLNFTGTPNATITYSIGIVSFTTTLDALGVSTVTTAALATTTTFTLTSAAATNTVLCSQNITGTVVITVNQNPLITAVIPDDTVCFGTSKTFTVTATGTALTYQWFYNGTTPISGATNPTFTINSVTILDAGNYSVVVSGICGSFTSNSASLIVVPPTVITTQPAPSQTVCTGETVIFGIAATGAANLTYQWFVGNTPISGAITDVFTITSAVIADSGNYTCRITSGTCGTVTSDTAALTVNQGPTIVSQSGGGVICIDNPVVFSVTATGTNLIYQWFKVSTGAIAGETTNIYTILNATEADSGTFYCEISSASCPNIQSTPAILLIKPVPTATISLGVPAAICAEESTQLILNGSPDAVVIYTINGGTPETVTLNSTGAPTILLTGPLLVTSVYELVSVTYTGPEACSQLLSGSATIIVSPLPVVVLEDGFICVDPITLATTRPYLLDTRLNSNNADYTFEWFDVNGIIPLATNSFYEVTIAGQYSVTITDVVAGCQESAFANVDQSAPPTDFTYSVNTFFADNPTVIITATPAGDYEYQLDFGPFQESNTFDHITAGIHTISVRDTEACDVLTKEMFIIDYPRYFTPNGDGTNDIWKIPVINTITMSKISIFDRFGKLVKEMSTTETGWDGTFNGQLLPATDYWFTINYLEAGISKEFTSHFSLKR